jgi:hypothetical protein
MANSVVRHWAIAVLIGCVVSTAWAQGGRSTITGTIFDEARAVLPGAAVTIVNDATGVERDTVSGPEGRFIIPTLTPGCRAFLADIRNRVAAGGFVNNEPTIDGDRRMGCLWSFSVGVQRQLVPNVGRRDADDAAGRPLHVLT